MRPLHVAGLTWLGLAAMPWIVCRVRGSLGAERQADSAARLVICPSTTCQETCTADRVFLPPKGASLESNPCAVGSRYAFGLDTVESVRLTLLHDPIGPSRDTRALLGLILGASC